MESIFDAITEWIKELLIGSVESSLSSMFGDVNEKVGTIAEQVGQIPQGWNANIFNISPTPRHPKAGAQSSSRTTSATSCASAWGCSTGSR
jgi:hypothetical protein